MSKAIDFVTSQIAEVDKKLEVLRKAFDDNTNPHLDIEYSTKIGMLVRELEDLQKRLKFLKGE